jgi:hypothetical protein
MTDNKKVPEIQVNNVKSTEEGNASEKKELEKTVCKFAAFGCDIEVCL